MNTSTGEIREYDNLTAEERTSGLWAELTNQQVAKLAQLETERLARRNNGVSVEMVRKRLDRAEAKRQQRAEKRRRLAIQRVAPGGGE